MSRNHIRKPVTLTPEQADCALRQLADTSRAGDEIPINLLDLMGDTFHRVYEEKGGFEFE